jgi:hypothetical protein
MKTENNGDLLRVKIVGFFIRKDKKIQKQKGEYEGRGKE